MDRHNAENSFRNDASASGSTRSGDGLPSSLLSGLLESVSDAIIVTDADLDILFTNSRASQLTGYLAGELDGEKLDSLIPNLPGRTELSGAADGAGEEICFNRKDGSSVDCILRLRRLSDPKKPEQARLWVFQEISPLKRAKERYRASEARLKEILHGVDTVAVQGYAMDGTVIFWNRASTELYGYTEAEALGHNLLDLIIPEFMREGVIEEVSKMMRTGQAIPSGELRLRRKDGTNVDVYSSHAYVQVPGEDPEMFCIDVDVTERKRVTERLQSTNIRLEEESRRASQLAEAAEAANRAKSAFLANMSHEIRTPMNGVLGFVSILLDSDLSAEQREQLEIVFDSAEALLQILNDILDLSKIEAGKMDIHLREFYLREFMDNLTQSLGANAAVKGLELINDIDPALPAVILGDPVRIRQVLYNLIHNAIKFSSRGSVRISLRRLIEESPTGELVIQFKVEDSGIGISAERLQSVFGRFEQVDSSATRAYGGTGLGLAIARQLAELMGGRLSVESELGVGSCFTFDVSLQSAELSSAPVEPDTLEIPQTFSGRILLAEDQAINRMVALRILEGLGLEVDVVEDGEAACRAVAERKYDLAFLDIQMPELDGLAATRRIRQMEEAGTTFDRGRLPILALTAHALVEHHQACTEVDMDGLIAKPVSRSKIAQAVAQWLPSSDTP